MTFSHMFRRTTPYSSKWVTCLFTSDSGNCLLISIVNISTHIHFLSPSPKPLADSSLLRGAEVAEDMFTPMSHSYLHQAGDWLACCKGKCACLFALWHVCMCQTSGVLTAFSKQKLLGSNLLFCIVHAEPLVGRVFGVSLMVQCRAIGQMPHS